MEGSLSKSISIIHRNLCSHMDRLFRDSDIGHGPRRFLVEIALFPGLTQEEVSEKLLMDKTTTARAVKQLENGGYITRSRDLADRRRYLLNPTEKGSEVLPKVLEARKDCHLALAKGFSEEELEMALEMLQRLADNAVSLRRSPEAEK
ncbi:MAG: MarR family transcriptional regulator [Thermovirga sp.]|jgi:DNA-binding MarR family transcriptional regulator|nr:MarR family transcriptional regulator [Thermovirga sp.]